MRRSHGCLPKTATCDHGGQRQRWQLLQALSRSLLLLSKATSSSCCSSAWMKSPTHLRLEQNAVLVTRNAQDKAMRLGRCSGC
jgi:hypothetical protein